MIDVTNKNIFLSGPMTGIKNNNVAAFCDAQATLHQMGAAEVYNPAHQWLQCRCPTDKPHEYWMVGCINDLTEYDIFSRKPKYDMLVRLPEWIESAGSVTEVQVARACGIPVYELSEVIGDWTQRTVCDA